MRLFVLGLTAFAGTAAFAAGWPIYGHDVRQSRFNAGEIVIGPQNVGSLHQAWFLPTGGPVTATPIEVGGVVYVGSWDHTFYALDATTGVVKWKVTVATPQGDSKFPGIQSSAAIANGRVYFSTSEETYCIGKNGAKGATTEAAGPLAKVAAGPVAQVQVVPADVVLHPGASVNFTVRGYDADGNLVGDIKDYEWSIPTPPVPPGAKQGPPALKGKLADDKLTVDAKVPNQAGYVVATLGKLSGKARVRVAPTLPYTQDFAKVPDGAYPGGWVNTQGKFLVKTLDKGEKVLAKVNDKASPLIARGNAYIGEPTLSDYTIQCDVMGTKVGGDMPDVGVVANRYTLMLQGNIQKLRLVSWSALPRVDETIEFAWQPGTWYSLKLTSEMKGGKMTLKGKCWPRDEKEPQKWTVELADAYPNTEGAPALYGYVLGIPPAGGPGTDIYYANVRVSKN